MTTATKTKRETWIDWLPDRVNAFGVELTRDELSRRIPLITRDELARLLNARGLDVSADNLRSWEYLGVIPQPIRRRHEGATRALYPSFMTDVVARLRELQSIGIDLGSMGAELRHAFIGSAIKYADTDMDTKINVLATYGANDLPEHVVETLATVARFWEMVRESPVASMQLVLKHEDGRETPYTLRRGEDGGWAVT